MKTHISGGLFICVIGVAFHASAQAPAGSAAFGPATSGSGCPTCLTTPPPHTTVLNATNGAIAFPLPSSQRAFANTQELANFLTQNFNAELVYDSSGTQLIGARGHIVMLGHTYYVDPNNVVREITHPVNAYIGGVSGNFTIGGALYYSGAQGQTFLSSASSTAGPNITQCNQAGECISGHSWNTHWLGNFHNSVGFSVKQEAGGYQESHDFCLSFPFICTTRSGSNRLSLQGSFFYDPYKVTGTGPSYTAFSESVLRVQDNVSEITASYLDWFFHIGGGDGSPPPPGYPVGQPGGPQTSAQVLIGACAQTSSASINSLGATADGSTLAQQCFGAGMTCNNGTSFCSPNLCTNLSSDNSHCGSCGISCSAGDRCQSGVCVTPPPVSVCPPGTRDCGGSCVSTKYLCP